MTEQAQPIPPSIWARRAALAWRRLAAPRVTLILLGVILLATLAGWSLPQPAVAVSADAWITALPAWLQPWGGLLHSAGVHRLFRSPWFWLPTTLLLLNSLLALADTLPPALQRQRNIPPPVNRPHPLARRGEYVVRLPQSPDEYLSTLQTTLARQGFRPYPLPTSGNRTLAASRRRPAWLGPAAVYLGLILAIAGLPLSQRYLNFQQLTLYPNTARQLDAPAGALKLGLVFRNGQPEEAVIYRPANPQQPALAFTARLYRPIRLNNALVIPIAAPPVVTVVAGEPANQRKLIPLQEDLPPAIELHLSLVDPQQPQYFLIPDAGLTVQLLLDPTAPDGAFNVQVRRGAETTASETRTVQPGETFEIDGLPITLTRSRALTILVYHDPAGWLYLLSLLLMLVGLAMWILGRPALVWLIPKVRGLGGQLYGVVETLGPVEPTLNLLTSLLSNDNREEASDL